MDILLILSEGSIFQIDRNLVNFNCSGLLLLWVEISLEVQVDDFSINLAIRNWVGKGRLAIANLVEILLESKFSDFLGRMKSVHISRLLPEIMIHQSILLLGGWVRVLIFKP